MERALNESVEKPAEASNRYGRRRLRLLWLNLPDRGMLAWTVDGQQIDVGPGQALCIPRGTVRRFDNHRNEDVKMLCIVTPAAIGPQYFAKRLR